MFTVGPILRLAFGLSVALVILALFLPSFNSAIDFPAQKQVPRVGSPIPSFIQNIGPVVDVTWTPKKAEFTLALSKGSVLHLVCNVANQMKTDDAAQLAALASGTLADGRKVDGEGEVRIQMFTAHADLKTLKKKDIKAVTIRLNLRTATESGGVALVFERP